MTILHFGYSLSFAYFYFLLLTNKKESNNKLIDTLIIVL